MARVPQYEYEIILADNRSTDGTRDVIRSLAAKDKRLKAIFNAANFAVKFATLVILTLVTYWTHKLYSFAPTRA